MLISKKMNDKLNDQINYELFSSYIYLAMAADFEKMGLKIFAKYYYKQADEERGHAMKMFKYLVDTGADVVLKAVDDPNGKSKSVEDIVKAALAHELKVTKRVNDIAALAEDEKDYATRGFLQWYVSEQVEEVASAQELVTLVGMAGPQGILPLEFRIAQMLG